jgi:hypothetical protein
MSIWVKGLFHCEVSPDWPDQYLLYSTDEGTHIPGGSSPGAAKIRTMAIGGELRAYDGQES